MPESGYDIITQILVALHIEIIILEVWNNSNLTDSSGTTLSFLD